MATHTLKTWPNYWRAVEEGAKTFEVRRDDRGFQRGDTLKLVCFDGKKHRYLRDGGWETTDVSEAATINCEVTWILTGGQMGIEPGYVVMGLGPSSTDS